MAGHRRRRGGITQQQRALINRLNAAANALVGAKTPSGRIMAAADALRSVVNQMPPDQATAAAEKAVRELIACMPADLAESLTATVQAITEAPTALRGNR